MLNQQADQFELRREIFESVHNNALNARHRLCVILLIKSNNPLVEVYYIETLLPISNFTYENHLHVILDYDRSLSDPSRTHG